MAERMTLCTYERPAAQHDIDSWRGSMEEQGRILKWEIRGDGSIRVSMEDEIMFIYPVESHPCGGAMVATGCWASDRVWDKWIHFGKLLFTVEQYEDISSNVLAISKRKRQLKLEGV